MTHLLEYSARQPVPQMNFERGVRTTDESGMAHKVTGSILFAASTHPNSEVCELPRGSLLEGLECFMARGPLGEQVWGQGSRGEPNCTSSKN